MTDDITNTDQGRVAADCPNERLVMRDRVILTAKQLREALEYVNFDEQDADEEEIEVAIEWMPCRISEDGEHMAAGYYLWYVGYPEEGVLGPLGA